MNATDNDHDLLVELRGDMKNVLSTMEEMKSSNALMHADHEVRIRTLEGQTNQWIGKGSLVGGTLGLAAGFLGGFFGTHH